MKRYCKCGRRPPHRLIHVWMPFPAHGNKGQHTKVRSREPHFDQECPHFECSISSFSATIPAARHNVHSVGQASPRIRTEEAIHSWKLLRLVHSYFWLQPAPKENEGAPWTAQARLLTPRRPAGSLRRSALAEPLQALCPASDRAVRLAAACRERCRCIVRLTRTAPARLRSALCSHEGQGA
jgi:hypothetical protein